MSSVMSESKKVVDSFRGEYFFLSNFYPCKVCYPHYFEKVFPSAEHAYVFAKASDELQKSDKFYETIINLTTTEVKKYGREGFPLREDWDTKKKLRVMEIILASKFRENKDIKDKLKKLYYDGVEFVEGNDWGDTFWGVCNGVGKNHLGKLLYKTAVYVSMCDSMERYGETSWY